MIIAIITYIKPIEEVDAVREDHIDWIATHHAEGDFIASGRQASLAGGVILTSLDSLEKVKQITGADPYVTAGVAEYSFLDFESHSTAEDELILSTLRGE